MTRALVTSSKYSPGNMTPEALESLFVGRARVLENVLKRLADSALGNDKHYSGNPRQALPLRVSG